MAPASEGGGSSSRRADWKACYVYGITRAGAEVEDMPDGIGDPPALVELVEERDIAAIVSEVDPDKPLGTPDDLVAYQRVLDAVAAEWPVLPMRFGAVVTNCDAVASELLSDHYDEFAGALGDMEGMAEYIVRGRYQERAVLASVLASNGEAAELAREIRGTDEIVTRPQRIRLGEIVNAAFEEQRQADTAQASEALEKLGLSVVVRDPTHEQDAVHLAVLAKVKEQSRLEKAVGDLADEWQDRVSMRLLGPLAPYDFVGQPATAA